jgi:hypothetical protein
LLVVAAINGAILASAAGWAIGFALLAIGLSVAQGTAAGSSTSPSGESR